MNNESKKVTMTFEISEGLKKKFKIFCIKLGWDMGERINYLIMNDLNSEVKDDSL